MYGYSLVQWLFFFYIYCFIGWCFESAYVSFCKKRLVNRGFMRGPFLPLYGSGAIVMLIVSQPFRDHLVLTYFAGFIGATLLEYITGVWMEALFKVRYWDYSAQRFNYKGYVCLGSSIVWGFMTILMTKVIHKPIEFFVLSISPVILLIVVLLLTIYIVMDLTMSFKTALDLKNVLIYMEKGREELERMQKRLDVIIAVLDETKEEFTEQLKENLDSRRQAKVIRNEELASSIEEKLLHIKASIQEKPTAYLESVRDEVFEIKGRFNNQFEKAKQMKVHKDFNKRNLILGNPGMISKRYNEFLEELRNEIEKARKK